MNTQSENITSPYFGQQMPQSPFLLSTQHSGLNYNQDSQQSCWSIIKSHSYMHRQSKSPPGKRSLQNEQNDFHAYKKNDNSNFDTHCELLNFKTPLSHDFMAVSHSISHNDFRSCKILNFDDVHEEDQEQATHNSVHLKDVLGSNNLHYFTSPIAKVSHQKSQAKTYYDFSSIKSHNGNPFTPDHGYGASKDERLQNTCSTTISEQISEEDSSMMTPLQGKIQPPVKRHCQERKCTFTIRQLELTKTEDSQKYGNQQFQYTSPIAKITLTIQTTPQARTMTAPIRKTAIFGENSVNKIDKHQACTTKKSKLTKIINETQVPKRILKSEEKKQTLAIKLQQQTALSEIVQTPIKQTSSTEEKPVVKKCTCSKSKCLKLYCECFASGQGCGPECGCKDCCNNDHGSELIQLAKEEILKRDPTAFTSKVTKLIGAKRLSHRKGCTCKKSGCLKGYCECFQLGVPCTGACKCEGCANCEKGHSHQQGLSSAKKQTKAQANKQ